MKRRIAISDKQRVMEIIAVAITAIGKFVFMDYLNWRLSYVIIAVLSWLGYIYYQQKQSKGILKYWGFRVDNFKAALKIMLPFAVLSILLFFVIGYVQGTINLTWHILPLLISYPIWGSIQQYLTIGLVAGNLKDLKRKRIHNLLIILVTAFFFSGVHYPSIWLMAGTFILALFYGYLYLRIKNIYAMGLMHGWLGAIFYYTVVGSDPFQEIFIKFIT